MESTDQKKETEKNGERTELAPVAKSIVIDSDQADYINREVVRKEIYNTFNYKMLPEQHQDLDLTVGVTSPNRGEGKTFTAANLAVSFALAYKKKTALVDLNLKNPSLHTVFGTDLTPGLVESFENGNIYLNQTKLDQLYLLSAGQCRGFSIELGDITGLRDIIYSLHREFEVVVLDMNSIFPIDDFPVVFANEVDGLLIVLDAKSTKLASVEKIFRHINKQQAMGFVFNRVNDENF